MWLNCVYVILFNMIVGRVSALSLNLDIFATQF